MTNYNNAFSELDKIKNKAKAINLALELDKEEALKKAKELAIKEFEAVTEQTKKTANSKISSIKKVEKAAQKASKSYAQYWKKAFIEAETQAGISSANIGAMFANNDFGDEFFSLLSKDDRIKSLLNVFTGGFGGFFAEGGRPPTNKVSLVGELGPELFIPDTAGTIIPNENLKTQTAQPIIVNQQFTFQSLDPVTNLKMLQNQKSQIQNWIIEGIKNNQNGLRTTVQAT